MKYIAQLSFALVVAALFALTSCTTIYVDYTITGVNFDQVKFAPESNYSDFTADRDFFLMSVKVKPVHKKRTGALNVPPYPEGCVDEVQRVDFTTAQNLNVNGFLSALPILDGRCKDMQMTPESDFPVWVFHFDDVPAIVDALQTGFDPRFQYLISVPKGAPAPSAVSITTDARTVSSPACGERNGVCISGMTYVTATGVEKSLPKDAKLESPIKTYTGKTVTAGADFVQKAALFDVVKRMYTDLCDHPEQHQNVYSDATERYCSAAFRTLLKEALDADPQDEVGPVDYDYWFMTQEDVQAAFEINEVKLESSTSAKVNVKLKDGIQPYNSVCLAMTLEGGKWLVDDFITQGSGGTISLVNLLHDYLSRVKH